MTRLEEAAGHCLVACWDWTAILPLTAPWCWQLLCIVAPVPMHTGVSVLVAHTTRARFNRSVMATLRTTYEQAD